MISPCLSAAGIRFWEHPVPAGELCLPCGRPTAALMAADPIGVTVCHMVEIRLGRAPSVLRGRRCSWTDAVGHQPHWTSVRDVHDPIHRISRLRCSLMTKPHQGFTHVRPFSLLLTRARPAAGRTLGRQPSLHTPPLPATHGGLGDRTEHCSGGPRPRSTKQIHIATAALNTSPDYHSPILTKEHAKCRGRAVLRDIGLARGSFSTRQCPGRLPRVIAQRILDEKSGLATGQPKIDVVYSPRLKKSDLTP